MPTLEKFEYEEIMEAMSMGAEALSTSEPSKDLEEAAWDCVLDSIDVNNPVLLPKYKELLLYLFITGAKWQKAKMLKDAVDVKVVESYGCEKGEDGEWRGVVIPTIRIETADFSIGDQVKAIIVPIKED